MLRVFSTIKRLTGQKSQQSPPTKKKKSQTRRGTAAQDGRHSSSSDSEWGQSNPWVASLFPAPEPPRDSPHVLIESPIAGSPSEEQICTPTLAKGSHSSSLSHHPNHQTALQSWGPQMPWPEWTNRANPWGQKQTFGEHIRTQSLWPTCAIWKRKLLEELLQENENGI